VIVPDVNLLIYAYAPGTRAHVPAQNWWHDLLNGSEPVGLTSLAIFGFIRMATNPRILRPPIGVDAAIAHVESWLARPPVEMLHPGPRHEELSFRLLRELGTAGELTTDAQLAALAIENNAELHSADTDFGRFSGLRWVNPLAKR
jgi:toxin-antitoxin system PIN domain toxin